MTRLLFFLLAVGTGTQGVVAQTIRVRAVEDGTRAAVAGAIVKIVSASGRLLAQGLTNEAGGLSLRLTARGRLHLRADRIGFEGVSIPLDIAEGTDTVSLEITMPARPVQLPGVVVTQKNQCASAGAGGERVDILWNEIKKALEANQLTQDQRLASLRAETFDRWVDTDLRTIFTETTEIRQVAGQPFVTLEPDALAEGGYIREGAAEDEFFGPDAALLLADSFVSTHCFTTVIDQSRAPDQGQLGLRFAPVPSRTAPDIEGTLWVDRDRPRLRVIAFVNAPAHLAARRSGGMIRYEQQPNGTWIVRDWMVRTPRFAVGVIGLDSAGESSGRTLAGYREHGARAEVAASVPSDGAIRGLVFDSLANAPLAGVVVTVVGDAISTETDLNGEFAVQPTRTGDLTLEFAHPRLAFLPTTPSRLISSSLGGGTRVAVVIPPAEPLRRWYCPRRREGTGAVVGIVRLGANGPVVSGATVTAAYDKGRGAWPIQFVRATTSPSGLFVMCALPIRLPISIGVGDEETAVRQQRIRVPERGMATMELIAKP